MRNENEIYIFDYIEGGITAKEVLSELYKSHTYPAAIHINSAGGDVFEGIALYNYLKPLNVRVYIDGICASAASIIAMAGRVIMPQNALMMIHNPMGFTYGDADEMRKESEILDKIRDSLVSIYAEKTGLESSKLIEMMDAESWMNGTEAKELGFADDLIAPVTNKAALTYEDGVKAERERLRALDAIMSPGREEIISRAKYETYQNASNIAMELLSRQRESAGTIYAHVMRKNEECDKLVSIINRARGYK